MKSAAKTVAVLLALGAIDRWGPAVAGYLVVLMVAPVVHAEHAVSFLLEVAFSSCVGALWVAMIAAAGVWGGLAVRRCWLSWAERARQLRLLLHRAAHRVLQAAGEPASTSHGRDAAALTAAAAVAHPGKDQT
jgi:hypothetical protein